MASTQASTRVRSYALWKRASSASAGRLGFVDGDSRDDVLRTVRTELKDRYHEGVGIRLGAAAWVVTAQA